MGKTQGVRAPGFFSSIVQIPLIQRQKTLRLKETLTDPHLADTMQVALSNAVCG